MAFNSPNLFTAILTYVENHTKLGRWYKSVLDGWATWDDPATKKDMLATYEAYKTATGWQRLYLYQQMINQKSPYLKQVQAPNDLINEFRANPSVFIAKYMQQGMESEGLEEVMESVGALVYDGILNMAMPKFPRASAPELEDVRKFIGAVTTLSIGPSMVSPLVELLSAGFIKNAGEPLRNVYFNLGLGFVTWQMVSPMIEGGIGAKLATRARNFYRPTRFTQSQIMDLYALKKYTPEKTVAELKDLGWRNTDIPLIQELSATKLGLSQISELWNLGHLDEDGFKTRAQQLGYSKADAENLAKIHKPTKEVDTPKLLASTLTNALEDTLITDDNFRTNMRAIGYSDAEINLRLKLRDLHKAEKIQRLAKNDVEAAWKAGTIGTPEARTYLTQAGLSSQSITDLIDTWIAETRPKVQQLNRTTVIQAYDAGVFVRHNAIEKLVALGYREVDANIIIDSHDKLKTLRKAVKPKQPPVSVILAWYDYGFRGRTETVNFITSLGYGSIVAELMVKTHERARAERAATPVRKLSQGTILDAFETGVINETVAKGRLANLGYAPADVNIIFFTKVRQIAQLNEPVVKEVGRNSVEKAYQLGVITRSVAKTKLQSLGYTTNDAELLLQTIDKVIQIANRPEILDTPTGTILQALEYNLLARPSALLQLQANGYSAAQATLIIDTHLESVRRRNIVLPTKVSATQVLQAYALGLIDDTVVLQRLQSLGYSGVDAGLILDIANQQKVLHQALGNKPVDRATLFDAFDLGVISPTVLDLGLERLGYNPQNRVILIDTHNHLLAELNRVDIKPNSQSDIIRAYRVGVIERDNASELLESINLSEDAIQIILDTVDAEIQEQSANTQQRLSRSEIQRAYELGILQRAIALQELTQSGLNINDANVLIASVDAQILRSAQNNPRVLSRGVYVTAYLEDLITKAELLQSLRDIGYTATDAQLLSAIADRSREIQSEVQTLSLSVSAVLQALSAGVVNEVVARQRIATLGYSASDIDVLIQTHHALRQQTGEEQPKQLTRQLILDMLDSEVINREQAVSKLSDFGYNQETVTLILQQYDRMREQLPTNEPLPVNRSTVIEAYQLDLINRQEAISRLTELGYTSEDAEFIIDVETTVGEEPTAVPTVDQWVEALRKGLITVEIFRQGLTDLGIDAETIRTLEELALADDVIKQKSLSQSQVVDLYIAGTLSQTEAISRLVSLGYSSDSASELLRLSISRLTMAGFQNILAQKDLQYLQVLEFLVQRGYSELEAQSTILSILPKGSTSQILALYQNSGFPRDVILPMLREQFYTNEQIELLLELYRPETT